MEKFILPDTNNNHSVTKTFRLKSSLVTKLENVASKHNLSVNKLVTECIEFALRNIELQEEQAKDKITA